MKITKKITAVVAQCAMLAICATGTVNAADAYPDKTIKMVLPYPPGGPTDIIGRSASIAMSEILKQTIIVDNKAGASGMIGADSVARAAPDGYTILANASLHVIYPSIYKSMSFNSFDDFVPVSQLAAVPLVLVVPKNSSVQTPKDIVEMAREGNKSLNFGSAGTASAQHLSGELFKQKSGADMLHIPYKGSAPALTDLIGEQLDLMFDSMPSAMPFIKSGQLRAIAVTTPQRVAALPDVPTMAESGNPGFDTSTWYALWAPKGTPDAIVQTLSKAANEAVHTTKVKELYESMGAQPVGSSPEAFAAYVKSEAAKWAKLVDLAGVPKQ